MKKINVLLFVLISFVMAYSGNAWANPCSMQEEAATQSILAAIPVYLSQKQLDVVLDIVKKNPAAAFAGVSDKDMERCAGDKSRDEILCPEIFQKIMQNLSKLLSVSYRMANSIHIFNPNKVKYSPELSQRISAVMLAAN